jgi:hypothetical protein
LAKKTVSAQDIRKLETVSLRKCQSLELLEGINLSDKELNVDEISDGLVNSNKNSNRPSSEVTTKKNLTTTQQGSETKALKIKKSAPREASPTVNSAKHPLQKKQTTNTQADTNQGTSIKNHSLLGNKMKAHKQDKNAISENKPPEEKSRSVKESSSKMQKDVTKIRDATLLGSDLGNENTKTTQKKDNKLTQRKDNKMSESKGTKSTEKNSHKTKVSTLTKPLTVKVKTNRKLVEVNCNPILL